MNQTDSMLGLFGENGRKPIRGMIWLGHPTSEKCWEIYLEGAFSARSVMFIHEVESREDRRHHVYINGRDRKLSDFNGVQLDNWGIIGENPETPYSYHSHIEFEGILGRVMYEFGTYFMMERLGV